MDNSLICPLLTTRTVVKEGNTVKPDTTPVACLKERCGWWVEDKQKCAVTAIGGKK